MDPGDANYWECDFSKYDKLWAEVERHNLLESKDDEFEDAVEKYKDISDMVDDLYSKNENGIFLQKV